MEYPIQFESSLQPLDLIYTQFGIPVPEDILAQLPGRGTLRLEGTINGVPFNLAPRKAGDGRKMLTIGKDLRKKLGIAEGDKVKVFCCIADPNVLDVPEEFSAAIELDPDAAGVWQGFTTGVKRSLLHYVSSARQSETRIKRSLELCTKMKNGELNIQKK
jgi:hypothetical protein